MLVLFSSVLLLVKTAFKNVPPGLRCSDTSPLLLMLLQLHLPLHGCGVIVLYCTVIHMHSYTVKVFLAAIIACFILANSCIIHCLPCVCTETRLQTSCVCVLTVQTRLQELLQFQNNVLQQGEVKQSRPPLRNASPRAADCI